MPAVPTTLTYTQFWLSENLNGNDATLSYCFILADGGGTYDPTYVGNKDRLSNFRGWTNTVAVSSQKIFDSITNDIGDCCDFGMEADLLFLYATNQENLGSVFYTDSAATTRFNGGDNWYFTLANAAVQISVTGVVVSYIEC